MSNEPMLSPMMATAAAALPLLLVWAGAVDIVNRSIPNSIALLLAAGFSVFAAAAGFSAPQFFAHALCAFAVLAGGFLLYSHSLIGGGDAKLLASLALWSGFENILQLLAWISLSGGALSLACLLVHSLRARFGLASASLPAIPYGAAIAAGGLIVLPNCLAAY
jgi:prepilin peptidase CpaA